MKDYPHIFFSTLTDTGIFRLLVLLPVKKAYQYFVVSIVFFSLVISLILTLLAPQGIALTNQFLNYLSDQYPDQLQIQIQDGQLTSNYSEPVSISFPENIPDLPSKHLLVIDSNSSTSKVSKLDTFALMSPTDLSISSGYNSDSYTSLPWAELPEPVMITKDSINLYIDQLMTRVEELRFLFFPISLISISIYLLITHSLSALFFSFIIYSLGFLFRRQYPFQIVFKLSLYMIIWAQLIQVFNLVFLPGSFNLFGLALMGLTLIATLSLPPRGGIVVRKQA